MKFSDEQKCREAVREVQMRRRVYPRWVDSGRMQAHEAQQRIEIMQEIADDYRTKTELPL